MSTVREEARERTLGSRTEAACQAPFFREIGAFETLRRVFLPQLIANRAASRELNVWCSADPRGQEAYSIAMLLQESFPELASWTVRLIATATSAEVIVSASEGRYCQAEINRGLPARLLVKHFRKAGAEWFVRDEVRSAIEFRVLDWSEAWDLPVMDVVFLRNALAPLDAAARRDVIRRLRDGIRSDGHLFLGAAEVAADIGLERVVARTTVSYRLRDLPAAAARTEQHGEADALYVSHRRPRGEGGGGFASGGAPQVVEGAHTEQVLDLLTSLCIVLDPQGRVVRWNPAAELVLGLSAEETLGRVLLECPLDWDRARVSQALERASMLQAEHVRGVRCAFPDGSQRILELTVTRLEHGGRTRGWVLLGNDLTERLFLEEQLQHGSKLEAVGKLAAGIAHEINTPIQFVSDNTRFMKESASQLFSLIEVLRQVRDAAVDGTIHRDLIEQSRRIEREIEVDYLTTEVPRAIAQSLDGLGRVATIVRAMKTFAQPDATSEMAPADLNRALESTLVVAQNEIKYVADVATAFGELPLVSCHVNELNQVFLNILVNAAHAIGDVVAKTGGRGRIEVRTFCEEDSVVIAISDTGGGIPQEIRSRVFDPFFTTKEVGRGTGQGLSISRAIVVNRHGGALTVQSESGLGTTFFVRIPLNALETATAA